MRLHVTLNATDLMTGETVLLADSNAISKDGRLLYCEAGTNVKHTVTVTEDSLIVERKDEITSRTTLCRDGGGHTIIDSPYGRMELQVCTEEMHLNGNLWSVQYRVLSGNETTLHQKLEWKFYSIS